MDLIFSCTQEKLESAFSMRSLKKHGLNGWQNRPCLSMKKLNTMNPDDRKLLEQEMVRFLFEGHDVHIDGYTPPEK